jgi:hypothetical protein
MPWERVMLFEWKDESWFLLLEISHIGRLRDHADWKPMFQLFTQVNNLWASGIDISSKRRNKWYWHFLFPCWDLEPGTYKTASQCATIWPCWLFKKVVCWLQYIEQDRDPPLDWQLYNCPFYCKILLKFIVKFSLVKEKIFIQNYIEHFWKYID